MERKKERGEKIGRGVEIRSKGYNEMEIKKKREEENRKGSRDMEQRRERNEKIKRGER